MKENIVIVNFKVESEAYQALSELKRDPANDNYAILQAQIVKKNDNKLDVKDGFTTGITTTDDTLTGGIIGSLIGILGGPLGVLLGGSMGAIIGGGVDAGDAENEESLLEKAGESIVDGETAILLLAQEQSEDGLNIAFSRYDDDIARFDAAEIAAEVDHAREVEKQLAREAREKMRAQKTEEFKKNVSEKSEALKEKFRKYFGKKEN